LPCPTRRVDEFVFRDILLYTSQRSFSARVCVCVCVYMYVCVHSPFTDANFLILIIYLLSITSVYNIKDNSPDMFIPLPHILPFINKLFKFWYLEFLSILDLKLCFHTFWFLCSLRVYCGYLNFKHLSFKRYLLFCCKLLGIWFIFKIQQSHIKFNDLATNCPNFKCENFQKSNLPNNLK